MYHSHLSKLPGVKGWPAFYMGRKATGNQIEKKEETNDSAVVCNKP